MSMLENRSNAGVCMIGCGRKFRGDDQVGLLAAELLEQRRNTLPAETRITATESPCATDFVDCRPGDLLVLVDAARATAAFPAGTVRRIDYHTQSERLFEELRTDTHTLGVETALRLGDALGLLPHDVWIYAISCDHFEFGDDPRPDMRAAADAAVQQIVADVAKWTRSRRESRDVPISSLTS